MNDLRVCWISAGISSFMAGVLDGEIDKWIYIDVSNQHPDSIRFISDCEKAIGKKIEILKSSEYNCIEDCILTFGGFKNTRTGFAPCTNWLKKRVRKEWEEQHKNYNLTYVWGFDLKEIKRMDIMIESNPQAKHVFPLIDRKLTKEQVHGLFYKMFDFPRPIMYDLGYPNNNCVGCIKGGMGYWNRIRVDFPEVFKKMSELERKLKHTILKETDGTPLYLDELDPERGRKNIEIFPDCGFMCELK